MIMKNREFLFKYKPDLIIWHLFWWNKASVSNHSDFLIKNMDIGRNIIISAKKAKTKKLINLASSSMYQKMQKISEEISLLTGKLEPANEGYTMSKIFTTKLCEYILMKIMILVTKL